MWEGGDNCAEGGKVGVIIVLMIAYLICLIKKLEVTLKTSDMRSELKLLCFYAFTDDTKYFWVFLELI
jgi:hypothetical protein